MHCQPMAGPGHSATSSAGACVKPDPAGQLCSLVALDSERHSGLKVHLSQVRVAQCRKLPLAHVKSVRQRQRLRRQSSSLGHTCGVLEPDSEFAFSATGSTASTARRKTILSEWRPAAGKGMRTNSPLLMAGVVLTLMSPIRSYALQVNSGVGGAPRRLSASQLSGLHGLAATLMERNPSLAAGIAAGHVRVDTRSIRSVDALSDTLLSNSYVD